jgi:tetratricopeptide (TPR) repeat protein
VATFASLDIDALRRHTDELDRLAEELRDPALEFWASTWGFMTAVLVADIAVAERLITASTKVAADVGQPFMPWIATFGRSHLAHVLGRLEDAEALAREAFELAQAAGAPDAFGMFGIQLFWIRHDQGRLDEVMDMFGTSLSREGVPPLVLAAYCLALCELGRPDEARPIFDQLAATGFALPFAELFGTTVLAAAAAALGGTEHGPVLYERLAPHHALLATNGATTTGPVAHYLGLLARSFGRYDDALAHFEAALALEKRIGASVWLAQTGFEYARCVLARARPEDVERVRNLLRTTLEAARQLGLRTIERRAEALLQEAGEDLPGSAGGTADV